MGTMIKIDGIELCPGDMLHVKDRERKAYTLKFEAIKGPNVVFKQMGRNTTRQFEVLTAKFDPHHRPLNPWLTLDNDAVSDSGNHVLGWKAASEWFDPVTSETSASS